MKRRDFQLDFHRFSKKRWGADLFEIKMPNSYWSYLFDKVSPWFLAFGSSCCFLTFYNSTFIIFAVLFIAISVGTAAAKFGTWQWTGDAIINKYKFLNVCDLVELGIPLDYIINKIDKAYKQKQKQIQKERTKDQEYLFRRKQRLAKAATVLRSRIPEYIEQDTNALLAEKKRVEKELKEAGIADFKQTSEQKQRLKDRKHLAGILGS